MPPQWMSICEPRYLEAMAEHGATPAGGCNRQALTDEDKAGRDLFIEWCKAAGCEIRIDQIGNIFARRAGADASVLKPINASALRAALQRGHLPSSDTTEEA